jgi:hypothetical protein
MLSISDEVTMVEILAILIGIAITWAIYYNSDRAELPGEATEPDPNVPAEVDSHPGRTLE